MAKRETQERRDLLDRKDKREKKGKEVKEAQQSGLLAAVGIEAGLKFSMTTSGGRFVMMAGIALMPLSSAACWATAGDKHSALTEVALGRSGWMMWPARARNFPCGTATRVPGDLTTVNTVRMQVWCAADLTLCPPIVCGLELTHQGKEKVLRGFPGTQAGRPWRRSLIKIYVLPGSITG